MQTSEVVRRRPTFNLNGLAVNISILIDENAGGWAPRKRTSPSPASHPLSLFSSKHTLNTPVLNAPATAVQLVN
jgi:hypothetical protein